MTKAVWKSLRDGIWPLDNLNQGDDKLLASCTQYEKRISDRPMRWKREWHWRVYENGHSSRVLAQGTAANRKEAHAAILSALPGAGVLA